MAWGLCAKHLFELADGLDVFVRRPQPSFHGVDRQVGGAELLPSLCLARPALRVTAGIVNSSLDADRRRIAAGLAGIAPHAVQRLLPRLVRRKLRDPAIGQAPDPANDRLGPPA